MTLSYLSIYIPEEYRTSLATFLNSVVNGLGASLGYLLSGYLIEIYGTVVAFEIYAVLCGVVTVLITGVYIYVRKVIQGSVSYNLEKVLGTLKHQFEKKKGADNCLAFFFTDFGLKKVKEDTITFMFSFLFPHQSMLGHFGKLSTLHLGIGDDNLPLLTQSVPTHFPKIVVSDLMMFLLDDWFWSTVTLCFN